MDSSIQGLVLQRYTLRPALNELFELVVEVHSTDPSVATDPAEERLLGG